MISPNMRIAWFELRIAGEVAAKLRPGSAAMLVRIGLGELYGKPAESPHCDCAPYHVLQSDIERGFICTTCGKKVVL